MDENITFGKTLYKEGFQLNQARRWGFNFHYFILFFNIKQFNSFGVY